MQHGINLGYFVKLSTHTKIALLPCDREKSVTKSILQEVNLGVVIGNGCIRLMGKDAESLIFLQTSHVGMNLLTEARSFGHQMQVNNE